MLGIFRQNLFINSVLLLPYTFLLRIHSLLYPKVYVSNELDGWINYNVFSFLMDYPRLQATIAIFIIFFQAVCINYIVNKHRLTIRPNLFPGLIYILLTSFHKEFLVLNPILFANLFLLLALINLMKTYRITKCHGAIFNTSFFICLASLLYFPYIGMLVAGFIGLVMLRSFGFQEKMQFMAGMMVLFYLLFVLLYYLGGHNLFFYSYLLGNLPLPSYDNYSIDAIILLGLFLIMVAITIFHYYSNRKKKSIQAQKKIDVLYWMIIVSPLFVIFWSELGILHMSILTLPLSFLLAMSLYRMSNKFLAELIHLGTVLGIIFFHFQGYFTI